MLTGLFRQKTTTCVSYHPTYPNFFGPDPKLFFHFSIAKIHLTFFRQNMLNFFLNSDLFIIFADYLIKMASHTTKGMKMSVYGRSEEENLVVSV